MSLEGNTILNIPFITLTVNKITKLVCNEVLLNTDGSISNFQWHYFQLKKICETINPTISMVEDITKIPLSNIQIGEKIKKALESEDYTITISTNLKKYGLTPLKLTLNDMLGGTPKYPLIYNQQKGKIIFNLENEYLFSNEDTEVKKGSISSLENIKDDICIKGRLKNFNNTCFMNSILTILFYNIENNKIRQYFLDNLRKNINTSENRIKQKLSQELLNIDERLNTGDIFKATNLVTIFSKIDSFKKYSISRPSDIIEFLIDLFTYLDINYIPYNQRNEYISNTDISIDFPSLIYSKSSQKIRKQETKLSKILKLKTLTTKSYPLQETQLLFLETNFDLNLITEESININELFNFFTFNKLVSDESKKYGIIITEPNWNKIGFDKENKPIFETKNEIGEIIKYQYPEYSISKKKKKFTVPTTKETIAYYNVNKKIEFQYANNGNFIIIGLNRISHQETFLEKKIIPDDQIKSNNKYLQLYGIICYQDKSITKDHFVSFLSCGGSYYEYNDLAETTIKLIGEYNDLLSYQDGLISRSAVLLIYC